MPSIKSVSGAHTSGVLLFNAHEHKVADLVGLRIDNSSINNEKIELLDGFTTDAGKLNATGATQAAEDLGTTTVASGLIRLQMTVPAGEFQSLGKEDLREVVFLGAGYVRGSVNTSDCVVVASYKLR